MANTEATQANTGSNTGPTRSGSDVPTGRCGANTKPMPWEENANRSQNKCSSNYIPIIFCRGGKNEASRTKAHTELKQNTCTWGQGNRMKRTTSGFEFYGGVYLDSPSPAGFGNSPWNHFISSFKEQIWTCSDRAIVNAAEIYDSLLHLPHASAKDPHGHVCFVLLPSHWTP